MGLVHVAELERDCGRQPRGVIRAERMADRHARVEFLIAEGVVAVAGPLAVARRVEDRLDAERHPVKEGERRRRGEDRVVVVHETVAHELGVEREADFRRDDRCLAKRHTFAHGPVQALPFGSPCFRFRPNAAAERGCTGDRHQYVL